VNNLDRMKIYLDNCCFNRPFDDQTQLRICLETEAKLFIQSLVVNEKVDLIWSYVLLFENFHNPFEIRKNAILDFSKHATVTIVEKAEILIKANEISKAGIKAYDSLHISCAIYGKCNYFITTDDRILKYKNDTIQIVDPIEFIKLWEEYCYE
jgi:predicted nucleic acid-binding protein